MKILVTGAAGFIGFHVVQALLARGDEVVGLDNINDYYDPELKYARLSRLGVNREQIQYARPAAASGSDGRFVFHRLNLEDREGISGLFENTGFEFICHLGAQAGVRYSLTNPHAYIDSNIVGFLNILEGCRDRGVRHLVYASSSSVYGLNETMPFAPSQNVDHPVSLYAASKKSNELMAHVYSHLYALPTTGLRFFTVYGPWGRPDMALFLFVKAILEDRPIDVFNHGQMSRDFTYIDDIVDGILRVLDHPPTGDAAWSGARPNPARSRAPFRIYNIGNNAPVKLTDFIAAIEMALGRTARKNFLPLQKGDVAATWADVSDLASELGFQPRTAVADGVQRFVAWYREYYGV